jgi:abortive infection bacteriophage resistance protein
MTYEKMPLSAEELVGRLSERGMDVGNHAWATNVLESINYYRLAGYWHDLIVDKSEEEQKFKPGTTLEKVLEIYYFDSELRGLLSKSLELFELSLRVGLTSSLALKYNSSFPHLDRTLYKDDAQWEATHRKLERQYKGSREKFARHFKKEHNDLVLPPIWATVELATFGNLRFLYQNLKERKDRTAISKGFHLDEGVFRSICEHLEGVRNICAHHHRIWNRSITKSAKLPNTISNQISSVFNTDNTGRKKIFNTILILDHVNLSTNMIGKQQSLEKAVDELLSKHPNIDRTRMGYPSDGAQTN